MAGPALGREVRGISSGPIRTACAKARKLTSLQRAAPRTPQRRAVQQVGGRWESHPDRREPPTADRRAKEAAWSSSKCD